MVKLPWQVKVAAKMVLNRLPIPYSFWKGLGLFDSGQMDKPEYALKVFRHHYDLADFERKHSGFVMLELGPGDSLSSGVIAYCMGASQSYLVDANPYAKLEFGVYKNLLEYLSQQGLPTQSLADVSDVETLQKRCNLSYLTGGLQSLKTIPDASVDFIWSQAMMAMVHKSEVEPIFREFRRILRPGGAASHRIDLADHINFSLNNLRFSEAQWNSRLMSGSGFYTNRLRYRDYLELFQRTGFEAKVVGLERWDTLPVPRSQIHPDFHHHPDDELRIHQMDVVLR